MREETKPTRVESIFVGTIEERWPNKAPSAIRKLEACGPQALGALGFANDRQADLKEHGGKDKAVHHYPADHYATWANEGEIAAGSVPAAFGENISAYGLTEDTACIGDVLRIGSAVVQISQGRQPCWKLNLHTKNDRMAYLFQKTGRTGWYYRVLEAGHVLPGDDIVLLERPHADWSVKRVTRAKLTRRVKREDANILATMGELAEEWRLAFRRLADTEIQK